jgi:hypothetical protein
MLLYAKNLYRFRQNGKKIPALSAPLVEAEYPPVCR